MKRTLNFLIILILLGFSIITLVIFVFVRLEGGREISLVNTIRLLALLSFNLLFNSLLFFLGFNFYKQIIKFLLIIGISSWILIASLRAVGIYTLPKHLLVFYDVIQMISYSILASGLILYTIHYIRKSSARLNDSKLFGKYHVHEGLVGILFLVVASFLIVIRSSLIPIAYVRWNLRIILAIVQGLILLFIYFGSFFFIRDWHDIVNLKFIELKSDQDESFPQCCNSSVIFRMTRDDLHFFKSPKFNYYSFGIVLSNLSIIAVIYGNQVLPVSIFYLESEVVILIGFFFCFGAGGFLGRDWLRTFKRFFPELYRQIEEAINDLSNEIE